MKLRTKNLISPSIVLLMMANIAFADPTQSTVTSSSSSANALVNGGNTTSGANAQVSGILGGSAQVSGVQAQVSGVQGGSAQVSDIQGGSAQVSGVQGGSAQVSDIQGGTSQSSASGGASSADISGVQGIGSVNQVFEASKIPPYMPNSVTAPVISPTLFSIMGRTAQMGGIPILSQNFYSTERHRVAEGKSNCTKIIYNGARLPKKDKLKDRKIYINFFGVAEGEVVGSITIQSKKGKADEVDLPTLIYDASQYINCIQELRGFNITLLSTPDAISVGMGIDSKSGGFSLSPLVSGLVNGPSGALLGLASGFSKTGGVTVPNSIIGCTFLVLIDSENHRRVDISKIYRPDPLNTETQSNGNGGKKYEATKTK